MLARSASQGSFWAEELAGDLTSPVLPDFGEHVAQGLSEARVPLDRAMRALLESRPEAAVGVAPIAALAALLCRYAMSEDMIVGRRDRRGDTLLRISLTEDPTFDGLAQRVARTATRVPAVHGEMFEEIFTAAERAPMPVVAYSPDADAVLDGVRLLIVREANALVCRSNMLSGGAVATFGRHLGELLRSAAADPSAPVSTLRILDDRERAEAVDRWNAPDVPFRADRTIWDVFAEAASRTPDAPAIVDGAQTITYAELENRALRYARAVTSRGLGAEALVGVCLDRGAELPAAILGVLAAGAAYVPLDPAYPRERLRTIIDDAGVPLVISQHRHAALVGGNHETLLIDEPLPAARRTAGPVSPSAGD